MGAPLESYVVRVYRCRTGKHHGLVGVIETPKRAGPQAFTSIEQLWDILSASAPRRPRGAGTKANDTTGS